VGAYELLAVGVLAAMFVVASVFPINMGLLGVAAAFAVGMVAQLPVGDIVDGFPDGLFLTLVGVTFLFAVANANGTIEQVVAAAVRFAGGHDWAIPWIMFATAGVLTAFGAVSPAAVAILAPIALGFAARRGLSPLLMGLMVVHGAQAGGFSPISVYGGITNRIVAEAGLPLSPATTFLASLALNGAVAAVLFLVLRRERAAAHVRDDLPDAERIALAEPGWTAEQMLTLAGLLALAVLTLFLKVDVGFAAIGIGLVLSLPQVRTRKNPLSRLPWSEIMLVAGVGTYVAVLETTGVVKSVGLQVAGIGEPLAAALLLCFIGAVVSAFASSVAVLGSLIPLAVPLLQSGSSVDAVGMVAAIAVSSTIVDVSPFSTNGALVLANAEGVDRDVFFRRLTIYGAVVAALGPILAWATLVAGR